MDIAMNLPPKFDKHPNHRKDSDVYVACDPMTFKPINLDKKEYFCIIPCGRLIYITTIMELGKINLLCGEAKLYYNKLKEQLERPLIKHFEEHDLFHSPDDTIGIRVVKQESNYVTYEKYVAPEGARYWSGGYTTGQGRMLIKDFALAVLKLNPDRYNRLIDLSLLR